jgi:SSS family solute:Na+ symporter
LIRTAVVIVYLAAVAGIGLWHFRAARRPDDYFVAGRGKPFLFVFGSLAATIIGASATLGLCGLAARDGFTAAVWLWGGALGLIVAGLACNRLRRTESVYTVPEYLGQQYGPVVRRIAAILVAVGWVGVIAAQLVAAGRILGVLADIPAAAGMVATAVVLGIYVTAGGQQSVLRTDLFQFGALTAGLSLLGVAVWRSPGAAAASGLLLDRWREFTAAFGLRSGELISLALVTFILFATGPDIFSRFLCARTPGAFRRAAVAGGALLVPFSIGLTAIGVVGGTLLPDVHGDALMPALAVSVLPEWGQGLVLAGLLAAIISSADTCLLTASTIVVMELARTPQQPDRMVIRRRMRFVVPVILVAGLSVASVFPSIIGMLLAGYQLYAAAVSPLLLVAAAGAARRLGRRGAALLSLAGAAVGVGAIGFGAIWLVGAWFGIAGGGAVWLKFRREAGGRPEGGLPDSVDPT